MSGSIQVTAQLAIKDPSNPSSEIDPTIADQVATTHDYVDSTPMNISTAGATGAAFVQVYSSVVHVERFFADVGPGADLCLRFGGLPASVLGSIAGSIAPVGGETVLLAIDGGAQFTATLVAGDNTIALAVKRINYYAAAQIASVDPATGRLSLSGARTGGADAASKGFSYGAVQIVGGTGLGLLGLVAGTTYGSGDDQRVGAGLFAKTFPSAALPARVEVSGTGNNTKFSLAGKAT